MRAVFLVLAALLLAGCGTSGETKRSAEKPPGPAPKHSRSAPPPAWAQTQHDSHWLAYSSYCWNSGNRAQCADFKPPSCADPHIPRIDLRQGETIRFHLGFDPTKVEVTGGGSSLTLRKARDPVWGARGTNGVMTVSTSTRGGDAAYTACLHFMRVATDLNIHPND